MCIQLRPRAAHLGDGQVRVLGALEAKHGDGDAAADAQQVEHRLAAAHNVGGTGEELGLGRRGESRGVLGVCVGVWVCVGGGE